MKLYMFRTVPLSIIRSFSPYTQQRFMLYSFADSCEQDQDGTHFHPSCPKHVQCRSKNKFEKLVHLVVCIIRNLSRCTVTWTSPYVMYF